MLIQLENIGLCYYSKIEPHNSHVMASDKEAQMKAQIASYQRKKDYYQLLGVSKDAEGPQIKKAYRSLALKFHPDKNKTQGAKQVFQKVAQAYDILSDPEKRNRYDLHGPEEQRPRPNPRRPRHQYYEYQFFGGGMGGMGGMGRGQQQVRGGFNFTLVFLLIFVVYTVAPLFKSAPSYATMPSSSHKFKLKTPILENQFFVSQDYFDEIKDYEFKKHSQMVIDREYLLDLQKKCELRKREKKRFEEMAYRQYPGVRRDNYLGQAKKVDMTSCRSIAAMTEHHEDYVRDLTYMKTS